MNSNIKQYIRKLWEDNWVADVKTKWHPKEGTFDGSASEIASEVASDGADLKTAMDRIVFYQNRAGKNLSNERITNLNKAKNILRKKFGEKEEV